MVTGRVCDSVEGVTVLGSGLGFLGFKTTWPCMATPVVAGTIDTTGEVVARAMVTPNRKCVGAWLEAIKQTVCRMHVLKVGQKHIMEQVSVVGLLD